MTISSSQIATCRNTIYELSPTLLPENIAGLITTASLATRVSLRCSGLVIDALFEGAKYGTSVSLGLGRNALTNAISTAKLIHSSNPENDDDDQCASTESGFLQLIDKYTDLGVHLISSTFTLTELFALSGLQFTSKTIKTGLKACEETVRLIDGIFGSTDTSRAIASIITLVHRELMYDPEFELAQMGKIAMLGSLTKALTAFALLQTVTHHRRIKQVQTTVLWQEPDPRNFPRQHIISNIGHFMRYASAAYGESFMRVFGIGDIPSVLPTSHHHHRNHHAFAHHTGVMVQDILLSSYTDHSSLLNMHHPSLHALVHYVTVDHRTKSIVLTCRGTLGLSDVLTDLSFTYTDFTLPTEPNKHFQAHDGMLDAAQLLAKEKGKVYQAIRRGLEQYPDYGLVLCGHSLGGGVVSLLGVLWTLTHDPVPFVTSRPSGLPAGRPVHCYVYGPPCAMSYDLSQYCGQGLVTSVVHGYDVVSCLSWGLIKDLKNVATSLHEESHTAEAIISRIIGRYNRRQEEEDQWLWATIKTMRADMRADKLYPPSTVYHVESVPQLIQNPIHHSETATSTSTSRQSQHRKAHMTTLTLCDDIQARFSEINFSRSMFVDHTPTLYEKAIRNLCRGFFGQEGAYENT
ncbi:uncharacterized protein BX664DRAFT_302795 [Halteromyces radiatus]|uniref:uncharacterized protein n=1 Tax=Halteromyces radiatus TaxID=101107 RepID=UPI00221EF15A|nr:uncharacterized protein BX664DRAFT_302795 [Halteromyces radiatus]KAI8079744.1 hypothetical protein BX664DRAFT_302795 [Halteromyces radiatus]